MVPSLSRYFTFGFGVDGLMGELGRSLTLPSWLELQGRAIEQSFEADIFD
jgi:hypothetical protein